MDKQPTVPAKNKMSDEDIWKLVAIILGIFTAFAGMMGWRASRAASRNRAEALEKYKAEAKLEISKADQRAAQAGVDAARADVEAAKANAEAAKANAEAAKANLELEKIKERHRPRTITESQQAKFLALVANAPKGRLTMGAMIDGEDGMEFALKLQALLIKAGYDFDREGNKPDGKPEIAPMFNKSGKKSYDIETIIKDEKQAPACYEPLLYALEQIGVKLKFAHTLDTDPAMTHDTFKLIIQQKPLPQE